MILVITRGVILNRLGTDRISRFREVVLNRSASAKEHILHSDNKFNACSDIPEDILLDDGVFLKLALVNVGMTFQPILPAMAL